MTPPAVAVEESHQEQLERLKAEVEALRQQLRSAHGLATVGTMAAMVAHEFNNILTPIISYAQLAQKNPSLTAKAIASASSGGQRASHICKAIMGIARGDEGTHQGVNLAEVVEETLVAMARDPVKDGIDLSINVPLDLALKTCRIELQQVLLNLLINARAAVLNKDGSRKIEIAAQRRGQRVVIDVADNGTGIPPENMDKIFQPFFTTKSSSDGESHGTGLGLAICKDIMAKLGGDISVKSTPGEGATFSLTLPADA